MRGSVVLVLAVACAGAPPPPLVPSSEPPPPSEGPREAARATDPEPIAPNAPSATAAREAEAAYRRIQHAYGAAEPAEYAAGYADPMECFYGRANVRNTRRPDDAPGSEQWAEPIEIGVLEATSDSALLVDTGVYAAACSSIRPHHKLVRLRRIENVWRITAEASLRSPGCLALPAGIDAGDLRPGERFVRCEQRYESCASDARGSTDPHLATQSCGCGLWVCLGRPLQQFRCCESMGRWSPDGDPLPYDE
jgi:hypothetical protein